MPDLGDLSERLRQGLRLPPNEQWPWFGRLTPVIMLDRLDEIGEVEFSNVAYCVGAAENAGAANLATVGLFNPANSGTVARVRSMLLGVSAGTLIAFGRSTGTTGVATAGDQAFRDSRNGFPVSSVLHGDRAAIAGIASIGRVRIPAAIGYWRIDMSWAILPNNELVVQALTTGVTLTVTYEWEELREPAP